MGFLFKVLLFLGCTGVGLLILKYTEPIVRNVGKMEWAERRLGPAGTYTVWKLIALALIVGSLIYVTTIGG